MAASNSPLVSVIVPCYNQAVFLAEAMESVANQKFQDWECIIIDDGSPDNTADVAAQWIKRDNRFKYISKQNSGVSSARNLGIREAKGKYILPLDADNKIGPDYLQETVPVMERDNSLKLVYTDAEKFGTETGFWHLDEYSYRNLLMRNNMDSTALFKREDFLKSPGYSEDMKEGLEDWEFWIEFLNDECKVHKIHKVLFYYRAKAVSRNQNLTDKLISDLKNRILAKHIDIYTRVLGNPVDMYLEKSFLEQQVQDLKYKLNVAERNASLRFRVAHFLRKILGRG